MDPLALIVTIIVPPAKEETKRIVLLVFKTSILYMITNVYKLASLTLTHNIEIYHEIVHVMMDFFLILLKFVKVKIIKKT
jgi:divalent metal cation (Fe/Co/Zn/Cd) transporter